MSEIGEQYASALEGRTYPEAAELLGVRQTRLIGWMKTRRRLGLSLPNVVRQNPALHKFINLSGRRFGHWTVLHRVADHKVRIYWLCRCDCGTEREVSGLSLRSGKTKSCGKESREALSARWKRERIHAGNPRWGAGRWVTQQGYVIVRVIRNDRVRYRREHRVVMEAKLGRSLARGENVHHVNADKTDNRPENLELWVHGQPTGQRLEDRIRDAVETLKTYRPDLLVSGVG